MKIAAFVGDSGAVAGFLEGGHVRLYERSSGEWNVIKNIALEINPDMGLAEMKDCFRGAISQLKECDVFIVREVKGLFHALLVEEFGFRTWRSEGPLIQQIENVVQREMDLRADEGQRALAYDARHSGQSAGQNGCGACRRPRAMAPGEKAIGMSGEGIEIPLPVPLGKGKDGCYLINLAEILLKAPGRNSRQVLLPFLMSGSFKKLEIVCDHIPRWFHNELHNLGLKAEPQVPDASGKMLKIVVVPG